MNTKAHKAEGIVINPAQVRDDYAQLTGNKTDMNLFNIWLEHSGECVDYYIDMMDERGVPHIIAPVNEAILAQTSPCLKQYMTGIDFIDQPGKQKTDDGENINHRFVRLIFEYGLKLGVDAASTPRPSNSSAKALAPSLASLYPPRTASTYSSTLPRASFLPLGALTATRT